MNEKIIKILQYKFSLCQQFAKVITVMMMLLMSRGEDLVQDTEKNKKRIQKKNCF